MPSSPDPNQIIEATPFSRADVTASRRGLGLKPIPITILSLLVALALIALFVFSARAVRFDLSPMDASLEVTDGLFTYRLGERYLMLTGDYTLTVTADGYIPLNPKIQVGEQADQTIRLELTKLPGTLVVSTLPETQSPVFLDQTPVGITPLAVNDVQAGSHNVSVRAERFLPFSTTVEIEGRGRSQNLLVKLVPAWALVSLSSQPTAATVSIDGVALAATPARIEVMQGQHQLVVTKPGFKPWQTEVNITAQQDQILPEITLIAQDGQLSIQSTPSAASVTIADEYRGQTPLELGLAPGKTHRLRLTKPGYETTERSVVIEAASDAQLNLTLQPVLGIVNLQVTPAGASLVVDGQAQATASSRLELTAVPHIISIELAGYQSQQIKVTPQPGLPQQFVVELLTEAEAKLASIAPTTTTAIGQVLTLPQPGAFAMGANRREPGRRANEIEKQVQLRRFYYLGTHEVTNAQYQQFDNLHDSGMLGRALLTGSDRPVVNVAWEDAVAFCNWLSQQQGLASAYELIDNHWQAVTPMNTGYRLPTEAEWIWASRYAAGPKPTRFPWGDAMPPVAIEANYADESAKTMVADVLTGYTDHFRGTAPVGSFPANPAGLFDMAGNVSEWMHDYYAQNEPTAVLVDPSGPISGERHVIKGSNYTHGRFSELRWTFRDFGQSPRPDVGFRISRYVE